MQLIHWVTSLEMQLHPTRYWGKLAELPFKMREQYHSIWADVSLSNLFLMWFICIYFICESQWAASLSVGLAWLMFWTFVGTFCSVFHFYRNLLPLVERNNSLLLIRLSALLYMILISLWELQSLQTDGCFNDTNDVQSVLRSMQRHINATLLIVGFLFLRLGPFPLTSRPPASSHSSLSSRKMKRKVRTVDACTDCEVSLSGFFWLRASIFKTSTTNVCLYDSHVAGLRLNMRFIESLFLNYYGS